MHDRDASLERQGADILFAAGNCGQSPCIDGRCDFKPNQRAIFAPPPESSEGFAIRQRLKALERRLGTATGSLDGAVAALDASLGAIRRNFRTVVSLSVLLVLVTALYFYVMREYQGRLDEKYPVLVENSYVYDREGELIAEFDRRAVQLGPSYASPLDFANSVINAAAGQTVTHFGSAHWRHSASSKPSSALPRMGGMR